MNFKNITLGLTFLLINTASAQVDEKKMIKDYSTDFLFLIDKADSLLTVISKGKGTLVGTAPDCLASRNLSKQLGDQAMVSNLEVYKQKRAFNQGLLLIANTATQLEYLFEALHFYLQTQNRLFLVNAVEGRKILEKSGKEIARFRDRKEDGI